MADLEFNCPLCNGALVVDESGRGLPIHCPRCAREIIIPLKASPVAPASGTPPAATPVRPRKLHVPKLVVVSGPVAAQAFDLIQARISIGRAADNMVCLDDPAVSSHHAVLVLDGTDYRLRDLQSANGCQVNGATVPEARLRDGDRVRIGLVEMRYETAPPKVLPLPSPRIGKEQHHH